MHEIAPVQFILSLMTNNTDAQKAVQNYYSRIGSRLGYDLVMGGSKHFGYYDPSHTTERAAQQKFLEEFTRLFQPQAGMQILDAGCGQGVVATYVAAQSKAAVTGITIVPFEVESSRRLAAKQGVSDLTIFKLADYADPLNPPQLFDLIYTVETLSHAPDVAAVVRNLYEHLKPAGRLVSVEYEFDYSKFSGKESAMVDFAMQYGALHGARQFAPGQFIRTLQNAGFIDIAEHDWTEACLPSFRRIRSLSRPINTVVEKLGLERHFVNTSVARYYADMAEQEKFWFKAYTATKPS